MRPLNWEKKTLLTLYTFIRWVYKEYNLLIFSKNIKKEKQTNRLTKFWRNKKIEPVRRIN